MENQTELMALLLDPCTKGNTSILSHTRWNDARLLIRKEYIDIYTTIKLSEYMQLKDKMKGLVSKKEMRQKLTLMQIFSRSPFQRL